MKKTILYILLDLVFLIVFNAIFFLADGSDRNLSVWISYAFIHIAYLMTLVTPLLSGKSKNSSTFGAVIGSVSFTYFILEFIVGVIIILINPEGFKAAFIIQLIMAGIYLVFLFSNMIANINTEESEGRRQVELAYVKESSMRLKTIMEMAGDKELSKKIEKAYDLVHSSQTRSDIAVRDIELRVMSLISELGNAVSVGNVGEADRIIGQIIFNASERNTRLKLMN